MQSIGAGINNLDHSIKESEKKEEGAAADSVTVSKNLLTLEPFQPNQSNVPHYLFFEIVTRLYDLEDSVKKLEERLPKVLVKLIAEYSEFLADVDKIFQQLHGTAAKPSPGIKPSTENYNILINLCGEAIDKPLGLRLYKDMKQYGIESNNDTIYNLAFAVWPNKKATSTEIKSMRDNPIMRYFFLEVVRSGIKREVL